MLTLPWAGPLPVTTTVVASLTPSASESLASTSIGAEKSSFSVSVSSFACGAWLDGSLARESTRPQCRYRR